MRIDVCGVSVEVETEHSEFAGYLEGQFPEEARAVSATPDVIVRVRWVEGGASELDPEQVFPGSAVGTRIDRHVYVGDGKIVVLRQDDAAAIAIACAVCGLSTQ